jgi:hypothetical protein
LFSEFTNMRSVVINGHQFARVPGDEVMYQCQRCRLAIVVPEHSDHDGILGTFPVCGEFAVERLVVDEQLTEKIQIEVAEAAEHLGLTLADVKHWAGAILKWRKAGYPTRTDEEVARIAALCKGCEHYRDTWLGGRCAKCGCRVNESSIVVTNKIRMATEDCPLGKWPKRKGTP